LQKVQKKIDAVSMKKLENRCIPVFLSSYSSSQKVPLYFEEASPSPASSC
jgi:hypothetical protein